ncbi:MAG: HEAT repeat domain-containing protein [Terrisporobacter othiniensis]|uniref:HEAT repeat domain-containing protein n=1 Tax=Terrisporobacter othiniensis TaxID=1577792 RepID=UPI00094238F9|nr:HEAT repeat domain-containing protein [Terrisporobacter othiniensis]MDY3371746.1 HEAT repeat domain-containing protein [Terrisporobacter othiniensis]
MIKVIFSTISIFLYYLICVCLYIIYNNLKSKEIYKNLNFINEETYKIMQVEIKNLKEGKSLNNKNINKLKKNLKSKNYQKHIIKYLLNKDNKEELVEFIKEANLINLVFNKKQNDEFEKAYNIYLIGELSIQNCYSYLTNNIDTNSVYIQINILKTLSKLGNKVYFIKALKEIIGSHSLIHEKVLIDVLYTFYKKDKSLNIELKKELDNGNIELIKVIITHFINTRYDEPQYSIYHLLKNKETDKEVKIACIKYFSKIDFYKCKDILIELLQDENWEIRAISANALKQYRYKDVIIALQESVKDEVWYVRQNSANSLYSLVNEKDDLKSIINGNDRYASDSIMSVFSEENINEYSIDIKEECVVNMI